MQTRIRTAKTAKQSHSCQQYKREQQKTPHALYQMSPGVSLLRLDLETLGSSATTGLLELAALGSDVGLLVLVGTEAEVLDGLASVLGATEKEGVGTSGLLEGELVEGDGLATGSLDASTGSGGEAEGSNRDLGDGQETVVIGDGTDNNDGLLLVALEVGGNARDGHGRTVDAGHEQPAEHDLVEGRVSAAGKEAVKLDQELQVDIVALGGLAVSGPLVVLAEIDTYSSQTDSQSAFNGSGMLRLACHCSTKCAKYVLCCCCSLRLEANPHQTVVLFVFRKRERSD